LLRRFSRAKTYAKKVMMEKLNKIKNTLNEEGDE